MSSRCFAILGLSHSLVAVSLASALSAQAPTPLAPGLSPNTTTIYGFGDSSTKLLVRPSTPTGNFGWFDAAGGPFTPFLGVPVLGAIKNILWERTSSPNIPNNAYFVHNDSTVLGHSELWRTNSATALRTLSANPADEWTLDAISPNNSQFYLRRETGPFSGRFVPSYWAAPMAAAAVLGTNPPDALQPLALSPLGDRVAYVSSTTTGQRVTVLWPLPPSSPVATNYAVPAGMALDSLAWIDDRYLVARMFAGATPMAGRIVRMDRQNPNAPFVDLTLTGTGQTFGPLKISGDRQWISFVVQQPLGSMFERSAAAMRIKEGVATTSPGGGFTILSPVEAWDFLPAGVHIQQSPVNPQDPTILFPGRPPATTAYSFYRAGMLYDVSIVGRTSEATGTTIEFRGHHNIADQIWGMAFSLNRSNTPVALLDNPALLGAWFITFDPLHNESLSIQLTPTGIPFNAEFLFQPIWYAPSTGLSFGRVTHLPVF